MIIKGLKRIDAYIKAEEDEAWELWQKRHAEWLASIRFATGQSRFAWFLRGTPDDEEEFVLFYVLEDGSVTWHTSTDKMKHMFGEAYGYCVENGLDINDYYPASTGRWDEEFPL